MIVFILSWGVKHIQDWKKSMVNKNERMLLMYKQISRSSLTIRRSMKFPVLYQVSYSLTINSQTAYSLLSNLL